MITSPGPPRRKQKERVRATRACDRCKLYDNPFNRLFSIDSCILGTKQLMLILHSKKARCSGHQPCTACLSLGVDCLFNASYRRGKLPEIQAAMEVTRPSNGSNADAVPTTMIRPVANVDTGTGSDSLPSAYQALPGLGGRRGDPGGGRRGRAVGGCGSGAAVRAAPEAGGSCLSPNSRPPCADTA